MGGPETLTKMLPVLLTLPVVVLAYYWELQIHQRKTVVDIGHVLATPLYQRFTKLSATTIHVVNLFYGIAAAVVLPLLLWQSLTQKTGNLENFLIGLILRCVTGTLTQMPCPEENSKYFRSGELGGFGPNRSMIW